jgi:hypothetical protein
MKLTFATFILKKVLFSCERIWMSSGGGPDPLDPPLIYATGNEHHRSFHLCRAVLSTHSFFYLNFKEGNISLPEHA